MAQVQWIASQRLLIRFRTKEFRMSSWEASEAARETKIRALNLP